MPSRASRQNIARKGHVRFIVKQLAKRLSTRDHQKRMLTTNRLLPMGTLKRAVLKNLFNGWVQKKFLGSGRVITKKLSLEVVRKLRSQLELPPCHDFKDEACRMQYILKVARKRLGPPKNNMSAMDALETLPMEQCDEDVAFYGHLMNFCRQDWLFVFTSTIKICLPSIPINPSYKSSHYIGRTKALSLKILRPQLKFLRTDLLFFHWPCRICDDPQKSRITNISLNHINHEWVIGAPPILLKRSYCQLIL